MANRSVRLDDLGRVRLVNDDGSNGQYIYCPNSGYTDESGAFYHWCGTVCAHFSVVTQGNKKTYYCKCDIALGDEV